MYASVDLNVKVMDREAEQISQHRTQVLAPIHWD